jgi:HlyD family secretion protein
MPASRLPARLLAIAVLAAVAGAIVWGFQPEPVTVEVREVTRGGLDVTVGDDGVTRIKERYAVSAPLAGRTSRVELDAGDTVEAGKTLLVTIEPTDPSLLDPRALAEAEARVEAARAARKRADPELARAKVQLEYTQADLDRARELFPSKAVSHEDLDKAERAWRTAVEEVKAAEYQVMIT